MEIGRGEAKSDQGRNQQWQVADVHRLYQLEYPYPLPNIDRLVDRASSFTLLSFMDAYSRYNQIRIHLQDEPKTTFITDSGTFCYMVMPFVLKNADATYQHLMDNIFKDIMGTNVEA
ncbi:hypothetical protein CR513_47941, partial [Mucuna pruriens]